MINNLKGIRLKEQNHKPYKTQEIVNNLQKQLPHTKQQHKRQS